MEHIENSNSHNEQPILTTIIQPVVEEQPTVTLKEVVPPLIDFLNRAYPSNVAGYEIAPYGQFGSQDAPENEVSVEICIHPDMPELNKMAFWTLVRKSGSERKWFAIDTNAGKAVDNPYEAPLRFKLCRSCFHMGWHNQCTGCLVIDHLGKLDRDAAERQLALLIGYIDNVFNLDEVPPEVRWMFEAIPSTRIPPVDDECDAESYQDIEEDRDTISVADDEGSSSEQE